MDKQRLIDANEVQKRLLSYYSFVNENTNKSNYTGETLMSYEVADMIKDCIEDTPTVDPETLPIVQKLRKELARVTAERDAAVKTIFEWAGRPECKQWDRENEWCMKHDREADSSDGCNTPEWRGAKEE